MATNRLPKGITQRGSKFRVSIMVAGVRVTATCDTLVDAIQRAEAIRLGVGHRSGREGHAVDSGRGRRRLAGRAGDGQCHLSWLPPHPPVEPEAGGGLLRS